MTRADDRPSDITRESREGTTSGSRGFFDHLGLLRENYRGVPLPTGVGALIGPAVLAGAFVGLAARTWLIAALVASPTVELKRAVIASAGMPAGIVVLGAAVVGLYDDMNPDKRAKGFRGHLAALRDYRVTAGLVKAFYGGGAALAAAFTLFVFGRGAPPYVPDRTLAMFAADTLVLALSMNAFNLLDLRPGRALKVWLPVAAAAWAAAWLTAPLGLKMGYLQPHLIAGFVVAAALFPFDLRERIMLGDAGTMALGALVGFSIIATMGMWVRLAALVLLLLLHVATERISLSELIERSPLLAALDRWGRPGPGGREDAE